MIDFVLIKISKITKRVTEIIHHEETAGEAAASGTIKLKSL